MRLNNQIEYTALKIILKPAHNKTIIFFSTIPNMINNSPIKFDVPGKAIFANEKLKKKNVHTGIIVTTPP